MSAFVCSASSLADRFERGEMSDQNEVGKHVLGVLHFSLVGHHAPRLE